MKRCPYKSKNPNCSWAEASSCSWSLLILEFKDNKKFDGSPIIQNLSMWCFASWSLTSTISMLKPWKCIPCFLVFDFNHINAQTSKCLCHVYHHFLTITLNHLKINETYRAKWVAQRWYVHFCAFSLLPEKASDSLFLFLFNKPLSSSFVGLVP